MKEIKGKFEVKGTPVEPNSISQELGLMSMKFEKQFSGPMNATGLVSMMGLLDKTTGSGGYVAIEKIVGEVDGKKGSFLFQHSCTMHKGAQLQSISVVPDSGTGELTGIKGDLKIEILNGQHFYSFQYEI